MNTEVRLLKEVQKIDNYEDAEMSFDFDWTSARDGCNEMELDGLRRVASKNVQVFLLYTRADESSRQNVYKNNKSDCNPALPT